MVLVSLVLAAAAFELMPPLIIRALVDDHLIVRQPEGVLVLAVLYLAATAAVQVMTFLYNYLAATVAQSVLSALRVRLFAHVQHLPTSYFDRVPMGDVISRCTADVEMLDTVFSSNVAVLLANLARLGTITVAMVALSRSAQPGGRSGRAAAGARHPFSPTARAPGRAGESPSRGGDQHAPPGQSPEHRGDSGLGRVPEFVVGFRRVLSRGLAAYNRATFYAALYPPTVAILSALAVTTLLGRHPARPSAPRVSPWEP